MRHPTLGVPKSKPRLPGTKEGGKPASKEEISKLNAEYLTIRNEHQRAKMLSAQMALAKERGELVSKALVTKQAAFLLISLRQRVLAVPDRLARRFVNIADAKEARTILREEMIQLLQELAGLPSQITNPNWLDELADEEKDASRGK
jgi:phage terminase Nu1 subunit (DNA packaging protein)